MMSEDASIYVCGRVADISDPKPESTVGECNTCKEKIYKMPHAPTHMPIICWQCAYDMIKELDQDDEIAFFPGEMARRGVN
jgi:formylmethanofuran dehydrogenase subunit E